MAPFAMRAQRLSSCRAGPSGLFGRRCFAAWPSSAASRGAGGAGARLLARCLPSLCPGGARPTDKRDCAGSAASIGASGLLLGGMLLGGATSSRCDTSKSTAPPLEENDVAPPPWGWSSDQCALWRRAWQPDWDGRAPPAPADGAKKMKAQGRTRHLLFIRHGQYDLDSDDHGLTPLGRQQSRLLAERLLAMSDKVQKDRNNEILVRFEGIWSSDVLRARQTAEIVAEVMSDVPLQSPDSLLAEGSPAIPFPQKGRGGVRAATLWEDSARIELAFRKYVHRDVDHKKVAEREARQEAQDKKRGIIAEADKEKEDYHPVGVAISPSSGESALGKSEHVFEIIVCHCNVIRYFVMRALQLPPEAWLRLGGYNTGITEIVVRPNGGVSLVRFGDTGHLPLDMVTFH